MGLNVIGVECKAEIYEMHLQAWLDPEAKRKAIGNCIYCARFDEELIN